MVHARPTTRRAPQGRRTRRGAALVEFALTLPVLVLMLLGTIEFGNYFTQLAVVKNAARDAARFGSNQATLVLAQTQSAAAARIVLSDVGFPCATGNACSVDASIVQAAGMNFIQVDVVVPYEQVTGIIPAAYGGGGAVNSPTLLHSVALYPMVGP